MNQQDWILYFSIMACMFSIVTGILNLNAQTQLYNERLQHLNNIEANLIDKLKPDNIQIAYVNTKLRDIYNKVDKIPIEREYDVSQMFWNHTLSTFASGYYVPNAGFWVDTRGKFLNEINDTIHHEFLHALIAQDIKSKRHFCYEENVE